MVTTPPLTVPNTEARSTAVIHQAIDARGALCAEPRHESAFRLLQGFGQGLDLVIDIYGTTALLHDYADPPQPDREARGAAVHDRPALAEARRLLRARLPWLTGVWLKTRSGATAAARNGALIEGATPTRKIREHGVLYALDLGLNRDASLYLDTRLLRRWATERLRDKLVLNTFAYTGSLGVAAAAGGARRVVHLDLNRTFLNLAKASYALNGLPVHKADFRAGDFFPQISQLRREGSRFDCVLLDPPFFSVTPGGVVALERDPLRLINKVRPLVSHDGYLVAVNNSLYLSGADYYAALQAACADGYLAIEELIPVPDDFVAGAAAVTDPAPFNHSTKIAVLRARRPTGGSARRTPCADPA